LQSDPNRPKADADEGDEAADTLRGLVAMAARRVIEWKLTGL